MADVKDNPVINYAAAAAQQEARSTQTALDVNQAMDDQQDASNAAEVATLALGSAQATISNEKNAFSAATDAKVKDIQNVFGSDPTAVGSASNMWLQRMQENAQKAYDSLDVIHDKQSKTLLSDPLGFINAQFTLPADIATHNYYAEKSNVAEAQLNELNQASDASVIAARRAGQTTSQELAIAQAQEASQNAQLGVAKLVSDAAGKRISGLAEINALNQQQMQTVFAVHAAANSDAALAEQTKMREATMQDRKDRLAAQSGEEDTQDAMRAAYNATAKRLNKPTIDDPISWKVKYRSNVNNPEFADMIGQGQDIISAGGVTNGIAMSGSAGKTALLYASGSTNGLKLDNVGSFLADQVTAVKSLPGAPKDRESLAGAITERATNAAKTQLQEIRSDHPNIYSAPPPSVVLEATGSATGPFLDSVVRPIVNGDPTVKIPDDVMMGKAYDFAKGKGNIDAAAQDISTYYQIAALKNNLLNQYDEKGLPKQTAYNANIDGKIVNLADPLAVKKNIVDHNFAPLGSSPFGFR